MAKLVFIALLVLIQCLNLLSFSKFPIQSAYTLKFKLTKNYKSKLLTKLYSETKNPYYGFKKTVPPIQTNISSPISPTVEVQSSTSTTNNDQQSVVQDVQDDKEVESESKLSLPVGFQASIPQQSQSLSTSLAVQSNTQLATMAAEAAKTSASSLTSLVTSLAEVTVDFTRSDEAAESFKAVTLAANAIAEIGKGSVSIWMAASIDWKNATSGLEDVEASDEYLNAFSKAFQRVANSKEVKAALVQVGEGARKGIKEILTASTLALTAFSSKVSTSESLRISIADVVNNLGKLILVLAEVSKRVISDAISKELPPATNDQK